MLSGHYPPYVGRFACDWHRLATTDPEDGLYCATSFSIQATMKNLKTISLFQPFEIFTFSALFPKLLV
jgi:hypothetical protein